jgi:predicted nucleotidyltransferase
MDGVPSICMVISPSRRYSVRVDVSRPISAIAPSLEGEVLQTLAGTTMVMTGRQVALMTGRRSHSGVLDALHRLAEQGLVDRVELNRAFLFSLNREHLAANAVIALTRLRITLVDELRREIAGWEIAPIHASLFGSAARGDGDVHSDIDLFIVRPGAVNEEEPQWRTQVDGLSAKIGRWTGNRASIVDIAEAESARLKTERPPIVDSLDSDAIPLAGAPIASLFGSR